MMAEHHEAALAGGTKIVHCCGYDSIPSDLGTQAVADYTRATYDRCSRQCSIKLQSTCLHAGAQNETNTASM